MNSRLEPDRLADSFAELDLLMPHPPAALMVGAEAALWTRGAGWRPLAGWPEGAEN